MELLYFIVFCLAICYCLSMNNKDIKNNPHQTNDLQALSQTLLPLAKNILGKKGFIETDIIACWNEIIGEQLAQYSFPQKIDFPQNKRNNGCLHLAVPSGAFAVEIKHQEKYILDKINTYFGYNAISSLKIIQNNELSLTPQLNNKTKINNKASLTKEEIADIQNASNEIKNKNLKEILIKLGHSIYADNHKKEKKQDEI